MNILTASRLFTFVREGTMYEISTACFIYRSIFAVQALRKRRVQGHCAAYHFRILVIRLKDNRVTNLHTLWTIPSSYRSNKNICASSW